MRYVHNVLHVFFGTPRRAGWTLGVLALVYFALRPGDLLAIVRSILHNVVVPIFQETVTAVANAIGPVIGPIVVILLLVFGFKYIWKSVRPSSKR